MGAKIETYDVAVIGGGPAGATCALVLAQKGVSRVAVIDKQVFPRDKACGDGLGPGVVRIAEELGLDDLFNGYKAVTELSVSGPSNRSVTGSLPLIGGKKPEGYVIPRLEFDNRLFQNAIGRGVTNLSGHALKRAEYDYADEIWTLTLRKEAPEKDDREEKHIRCRVLVGADGARSKVRQSLKVQYNSDMHTGTAVRIYASSTQSQSSALHLDFVEDLLPAYGWMFPISKHKVNVGVGIDVSRYKKLKYRLGELLTRYEGDIQHKATLAYDDSSYRAFLLPYGSELPRLGHTGKRAALIGDAGSMINPLTGEGIFYGMFAGKVLAEQLAESIVAENSAIYSAIHQFERIFRSRFEEHFKLNAWMKDKTSDPLKCALVIKACERDRVVLADLIDLMMGDKRNLSGSTMLRIFWSGLLPA